MENNNKTEVDYEEAFQKFLEARKGKKKKIPGWIILATSIAVLLVIIVVLIKPWSLFENGENQSADIYQTEAYTSQQEMENSELQVADGEVPVNIITQQPEQASEETPAEAPIEAPAETPAPETPQPETVPLETAAQQAMSSVQEAVVDTSAQQVNTTVIGDTTQTAGTEGSNASTISAEITTGRPVQDNAALFSQAESDHINALVETGDLAFSGFDFFVIANSGGDGLSNNQYAQDYYKQLVSKKMATGNGIVIFINTADMTANVVLMGTAEKRLGSSGRKALTQDFVEVFRSSGSYADATSSAYNMARDMIMEQLENEAETWGDTSDSWVESEDVE